MGKTYSNHELGSLELPEGDIDSDTTLTFGFQLVQDPGYGQPRSSGGSRPMGDDNNVPYLKEPLPSSAASFSNFSMVRLSIPPHL